MNLIESKTNRGITLIALVITIIVLLILAGVSIAMLTGENGILTQAQRAKSETENAQKNEEGVLDNYAQYIEGSTNGGTLTTVTGNETSNTTVQDSLGNKVVVPAGFRVVNPGDNVEDGIVIEDVSHGATAGSQFVWIPVGTIQTSKGEITINLGRYTFDSTTGEPSQYNGDYTEERFEEHTYNNTPAKDINNFISKAGLAGGYYIGRYEARTEVIRTSLTADNKLTQITTKANDYVYNWVTQLQAAKLSRNMYNDSNFESDLMNSYAWDTAIVFLQECDDREEENNKPYSKENSLNTESVATQGTNNLEISDQVCNIFDMASNCYEWTTETYSRLSAYPCVARGGVYASDDRYTDFRTSGASITYSNDYDSFRPILYL